MRVLHVIASVNPEHGGPMEGLRQLARANLLSGLQTDVVCFDPPDSDYLDGNAFRVYNLGPGYLRYNYHSDAKNWLSTHAPEYDAIVVNGLWMYHGLATWRALRGSRTPYFVFSHGMLDPWFRQRYPWKHLKKLLYWILFERRILRDAKAVFFTCEQERLLARQSFPWYRVKEVVTGYGTSRPSDDAGTSTSEFLATYPGLKDLRLLLYIGRIHEKKGCDLLLEAFARVRNKDPRLHLVMAGPGESEILRTLMAKATQLGIESQITWTGMISGNLKWGALRSAEIMCLPSHQENFGITVAEALACGTPVAISNQVNIWREIESERAGWVDSDTVEGTERNLLSWLDSSPAEFTSMRECAKRCFENHFRIEGTSAKLLDAIREAITPLRPASSVHAGTLTAELGGDV